MKSFEPGGRIVLLGDQGVGKTSIVRRFVRGTFNSSESSTIGASYFSHDLFINDQLIKIQIWDTAGQEAYRSLCPIYYRNADVGVVVCDVTNSQSFESVKSWIEAFRNDCKDSLVFLVGNKNECDDGNKEVSLDDIINCSEELKAECICVSALTGEGVQDLFYKIGVYLREKFKGETIESVPKTVQLGKTKSLRTGCC